MNLSYLCVCSGLSAATLAWKKRGWRALGFAEIGKYACKILAHHFPEVVNFGNLLNYREWPAIRPLVLVGGTPCQGFSLAGLMEGLDDPRSRLTLTFVEIAARYRPAWLVWENVPGVLSINGGRDFADILGAFTGRKISVPEGGWGNSGCIEGIADAYGVAWRVFDARYFGVPQRRRRVILVGYLGDHRRAGAVLLERESLRGDPPPGFEEGEDTAGTLTTRAGNGSRPAGAEGTLIAARTAATLDASYGRLQGCSGQDACHGYSHLIAYGGNNTAGPIDAAAALNCNRGASNPGDFETGTLLVEPIAFDPTQVTSPTNRSNPQPGGPCHALASQGKPPVIAFNMRGREGGNMPEIDPDGLASLRASSGGSTNTHVVAFNSREELVHSTHHFGALGSSSPQAQAIAFRAAGQDGFTPGPVSPPLAATDGGGAGVPTVAYTLHGSDGTKRVATETELSTALTTSPPGEICNSSTTAVMQDTSGGYRVRRLMPVECERLMGVPDNFTRIPKLDRKTKLPLIGKYFPDSPRYHVLGNSIVVPVLEFVGRRIEMMETIHPTNLDLYD